MATYCLLINLMDNSNVKIGKIGNLNFNKGYYVYIGSALNSLEGRIKRHLRNEKKLFWHIDYLLDSKNSKIEEVIFERSSQKWECEIAEQIAEFGTSIDKFGCSDCKCQSHFFFFKNKDDAESACLKAFNRFKLKPEKYLK